MMTASGVGIPWYCVSSIAEYHCLAARGRPGNNGQISGTAFFPLNIYSFFLQYLYIKKQSSNVHKAEIIEGYEILIGDLNLPLR